MRVRLYGHFILVILSFFIACSPNAVLAQNSSLDPFIGSWKGEGNLFGNPAKFDLQFSYDLNKKFLHLSFHNEYAVESKTYGMDAQAYYAVATDTLKGHWFDSRGTQLPVTVAVNKQSLTSFWGDSATEQGKTIYTVQGNELSVVDFVKRNGEYKEFGKAAYKRVNP